jgi:MarR family 2-MHQ and catechol resistance regulon transcriptional repressor
MPAEPVRPLRSVGLLAWLRLVRIFQKVDRASAEHLRCHRLSPAQLDVLARVGMTEGISQQRVADALLVTKGNVCQLLDKMEQSDLLERRREGRTNRLYLTERGRELYARVVPAHDELVASKVAELDEEEQRVLLRLLRRLDHELT